MRWSFSHSPAETCFHLLREVRRFQFLCVGVSVLPSKVMRKGVCCRQVHTSQKSFSVVNVFCPVGDEIVVPFHKIFRIGGFAGQFRAGTCPHTNHIHPYPPICIRTFTTPRCRRILCERACAYPPVFVRRPSSSSCPTMISIKLFLLCSLVPLSRLYYAMPQVCGRVAGRHLGRHRPQLRCVANLRLLTPAVILTPSPIPLCHPGLALWISN